MLSLRRLRLSSTYRFWRDSAAFAAHPLNPRMGNTLSMSHPGIFHDIPQLQYSDAKMLSL
jgi:hypothetical protein